MKNKRIVITGATGFVGSYFAQHFAEHGYEVYAFGRRKEFRLHNLVKKYISWDISKSVYINDINPDIVIHCAGSVSHWGKYSYMYSINVLGTENVIKSFPKARFIHISTASVYDPFQLKVSVSESITKPQRYLNSYQETKWLAEQKVIELAPRYVIVRPHAIYGPNDTTILPRLLRARKTQINRFLMIGGGSNDISLTYVGNLALGVKHAMNSSHENQIYNITDTKPTTMKQALDEFKKVRGYREKYLAIPQWLAWYLGLLLEIIYKLFPLPGEPLLTRYVVAQLAHNYTLSITKAQRELGYKPSDNYMNKFKECYGS
jgi:nucleoside-diphosphate-sugar epimerase